MKKRIMLSALAAACALAVAAPAASAAQPSLLGVVASSADNNKPGQKTDNDFYDFDVLREAAVALGLAPALADDGPGGAGLDNATVFAPNDRAFQVLVSDITNTPLWRLSEAQTLQTLLDVAGVANLNGTGIPGAAALTQTVLYHVSPSEIPNLRARSFGANIPTANDAVGGLLRTDINPSYIPFVRWVSLGDGDRNDLNPIYYGRTVDASNGVVHVISGVLRPVDFEALFPADD